MPYSEDRFAELRDLLRSYADAGYTFDDTEDQPGQGLRVYLRQATRTPERVEKVIAEIEELLAVGLFSESIAADVDTLPQVRPTGGRSVEEALKVALGHLRAFAADTRGTAAEVPETTWEWEARFPVLVQFLGAYFHQDFDLEYSSHREAVDDYLADSDAAGRAALVREIVELLALVGDGGELRAAVIRLGGQVAPPAGVSYRQWLRDVAGIAGHHGG
ncbi:contact-dependent growth inhibition system immunity protein [Streptomyces sp. NPDC012888]|uniref:contact-dependent growth inhibition system immunity protein n=1 Tax=Streptomyces sp. NPDC012888 TaxID=3364855 RepID=UPI0036CCA83F